MIRVTPYLSLLVALLPTVVDASENASRSTLSLEVVLSEKTMSVRLDGELLDSYKVAIGTIDHPTPEGEFTIEEIVWNPSWYPPERTWAAGLDPTPPGHPSNPMRVAKIPFDPPYYSIHGTDRPDTLGTLASHGCIRMSERDVAELGRVLMRLGGVDRSDWWFRQVRRDRKTRTVAFPSPIRIMIRMGEENVYPGVVWNVK